MEIKSRMLLPKEQQAVDPEAEEEEPIDPRWDLVHQLLQYKRFKDAAGELNRLAFLQQSALAREDLAGWTAPAEDRPLAHVDRIEVWNIFNLVLRRLAEKIVVGEISDERTTVVDQMEMILARLQRETSFGFSALFSGHEKISLRMLIVTFLAVLELTRLKRLRVRQDLAFTEIHCSAWTPDETPPPAAGDPVVEKQLESPGL
jgi:segregation and condensation protein A